MTDGMLLREAMLDPLLFANISNRDLRYILGLPTGLSEEAADVD